MIPKDMKLAIQILDKLEDDEIGFINDIMKWKAEKIFEDVELIVRTVAGDFGETPIFKEYQAMKKSHLSNYEPIGSSLNKDLEASAQEPTPKESQKSDSFSKS